MTDLTIGIVLKADGSGLVGEVKISREELDRLRESAKGVGPAAGQGAQGLDRMERQARGLNTQVVSLRGALGALGLAFSVREVINFGREIIDVTARMQTLETRVAAFVGRGAALDQTMAFIADTAQRQSQEIFTVAESYSKLLPLVDSGVISMQDARDILVGFADVAARTGATSAQLAQTMFGLSQGLSAGVLRAEELNQVVEPLPGLLQALDRAADQAAGGFRRMVVEGQVTSDLFRTTLIEALKEYEGAAEETAGNIEAAATRFGNAWTLTLDAIGGGVEGFVVRMLNAGTGLLGRARDLGTAFWDREFENQIRTRQAELDELIRKRDRLATNKETFGADWAATVAEIERVQRALDHLDRKLIDLRLAGAQPLPPGSLPGEDRGTTGQIGRVSTQPTGATVPESYAKTTAAIEAQIAAERRLAAARGEGNEALRQAMIANEAAALIAKAGVEASSAEADVLRGLATTLVDLGLAEQAYTAEKERRAEAAKQAMKAAEDEARAWEQLYQAGQKIEDGWRQMGEAITREVMTPLERFNEKMDDLEFLLARGEIRQETFNRAVKQAGEELADADEDAKDFKEAMRDAGQVIGTAFEDAIVNGKSFRDMLAGLEQDIIRIATRLAVTKPLEDALGGLLGGIDFGNIWDSIFGGGGPLTGPTGGLTGGGVTSAKGNAFQRGELLPFAKGGVVDRPVLFPMARGMGLMGEAGPEAVLPLKRGANGDLGVQASGAAGGDVIVQIIDQRSGGEIRTEESRGPNGERLLKAFIIDTVESSIGNGRLDRAMGQAFGASRVGRR